MSRPISVYKTATCRTRNFAAALQSVAKDRIADDRELYRAAGLSLIRLANQAEPFDVFAADLLTVQDPAETPMTNEDKLRTMTTEEQASFIQEGPYFCAECDCHTADRDCLVFKEACEKGDEDALDALAQAPSKQCRAAALRWLRSPVED